MTRSRAPSYTPAELKVVKRANKYVQVGLCIALIIIFGIAIVINSLAKSLSYLRRTQAAKYAGKLRPSGECSRTGKSCTRWLPGTILAAVRKQSCKKSKFAERFGMSSLGEVVTIATYYVLHVLLVTTGAAGNIDYMAHHAARLVFVNLPLVIGLASKNNAIAYATGFSYESLNVFHRWVARLILILSVFHVVGRLYVQDPPTNFKASGLYAPNGGGYLIAGTIALICFTVMILGAARPLRNSFYQFFIISHVVLFLVGTIALALHRPQIAPWLYIGFFIYFLDRIIRTGRIVYSHAMKVIRPSEIEESIARVEALSEDTIRVTVHTSLKWTPGQHVYLHVPLLSAGGHPFSVCSIDRPLLHWERIPPRVSAATLLIRVREGLTRRLHDLALEQNDTAAGSLPKLNILKTPVRPKLRTHGGSYASRGRSRSPGTAGEDFADAKMFPSATLPVAWAEGPYGSLTHLDYYQTVLLVAGGSGVSFTLPLMLDMVRRARAMTLGHFDESIATERLKFIWVIKEEDHIEWIGDALRLATKAAPPGFLSIVIHITSRKGSPDTSLEAGHLENKPSPWPNNKTTASYPPYRSPPGLSFPDSSADVLSPDSRSSTLGQSSVFQIKAGRPNLKEILEEEIESTDFSDYVAVGTCGPTAMTIDLANCVSDAIQLKKVLRGEHRRNLRFHCEEFGW